MSCRWRITRFFFVVRKKKNPEERGAHEGNSSQDDVTRPSHRSQQGRLVSPSIPNWSDEWSCVQDCEFLRALLQTSSSKYQQNSHGCQRQHCTPNLNFILQQQNYINSLNKRIFTAHSISVWAHLYSVCSAANCTKNVEVQNETNTM